MEFTAIILGNCFWQQYLKRSLLQYFWWWNYSRNSGNKSRHPSPLYRRNQIQSVQLPRNQCYSSQKFGPVCYNAWKGHTNVPLFLIKDESFFLCFSSNGKTKNREGVCQRQGGEGGLESFWIVEELSLILEKKFSMICKWMSHRGGKAILFVLNQSIHLTVGCADSWITICHITRCFSSMFKWILFF